MLLEAVLQRPRCQTRQYGRRVIVVQEIKTQIHWRFAGLVVQVETVLAATGRPLIRRDRYSKRIKRGPSVQELLKLLIDVLQHVIFPLSRNSPRIGSAEI